MAIDLSNLRIELLTGSYASAYSAAVAAGDANTLVVLTNQVSPLASNLITIGLANAEYLQRLVVAAEYGVLSAGQRDLWNAILTTAGPNGIAISNTLIRGQALFVWSAGTTTRANLASAQTRPCSRIEFLFGEGVRADANVIYIALTQA